ncbi:MAG: zinc-ribbon domain-containing protein [Treponema sp.]|nr:zinc-ribbon domain-containing protein [Treponema sp.]
MFFIFGIRTDTAAAGFYKREGICPACRNTINLKITRTVTWLTFFFFPVIPLSVAYYKACPHCALFARITRREAKQLLGKN